MAILHFSSSVFAQWPTFGDVQAIIEHSTVFYTFDTKERQIILINRDCVAKCLHSQIVHRNEGTTLELCLDDDVLVSIPGNAYRRFDAHDYRAKCEALITGPFSGR